jgi:hypothetical protein
VGEQARMGHSGGKCSGWGDVSKHDATTMGVGATVGFT